MVHVLDVVEILEGIETPYAFSEWRDGDTGLRLAAPETAEAGS